MLFPVTALRVAAKAVEKMLHELKAKGTQRDALEHMQTRQQRCNLLRYEDYTERDKDLSQRYGRPNTD